MNKAGLARYRQSQAKQDLRSSQPIGGFPGTFGTPPTKKPKLTPKLQPKNKTPLTPRDTKPDGTVAPADR